MTLRLESFYNMSYGHTIKRAIPKKQAPNPFSGEHSLKAAIYVRVSTANQHVESQLYDRHYGERPDEDIWKYQ